MLRFYNYIWSRQGGIDEVKRACRGKQPYCHGTYRNLGEGEPRGGGSLAAAAAVGIRSSKWHYVSPLAVSPRASWQVSILNELPGPLRQRVATAIAGEPLRAVPFFCGASPPIANSLVAALVPRVFVPGDVIMQVPPPPLLAT